MSKKAKTKAKPALPEFNDRLELKHSFSDAEKATILTDLSRKHEEKEMLSNQAKSSAKQWKSRIDEVQLKLNELSLKGRDGYEMRPTEVRVVLDKKRKTKFLYRVDNNEFIDERDMTDFDFERLPMELPNGKKSEIKPGDGLTKVSDALDQAERAEAATDEKHESLD